MMFHRSLTALTLLALAPTVAQAHFPFLHLKSDTGFPALHVYFAETAEPDDPSLLDRLAGSKVWQFETGKSPTPLTLKKGTDSLVAEPSPAETSAYGLIKDYGVLSRGDATFRLAYYAKTFSGSAAWPTKTSDTLRLDITPSQSGEELVLTVLWDGKPLPDAQIVVQGGVESLEGETDAEGRFACRLPDADLYSIRAKHVEQQEGEHEGKQFAETRHYATLTLDLK